MPRPAPSARGHKPLLPWLVRRVEVIRGTLKFRMECFPAFDYARQGHTTTLVDDEKCTKTKEGKLRKKAVFKSDLLTMELRAIIGCNPDTTSTPYTSPAMLEFEIDSESWPRHKGPGISAVFEMQEGEIADFVFREDPVLAEDVQGVPNTRTSRTNKAPIIERDGPNIQTPLFDLATYDPFLDSTLIQSLQDSVSFDAFPVVLDLRSCLGVLQTTASWYAWMSAILYPL